ncbi:MAG: Ger(x)C family spore germination protein [Dehalobacter sp.]|nr:Ger(x)C family spore germination protein [Dehalobacter sp.]
MKRKFTHVALLLLLLTTILMSGCKKEVEELAVVTMFAGDYININGVDQYQIWSRMMRPTSMEDNQKKEGASSDYLISASSTSLNDLISKLMVRLPKTAFYGHTYVYVFGARSAQEKILPQIEITMGNPDSRPAVFVLATKGLASQIIQLEPSGTTTLTQQVKNQSEKIAIDKGVACGVTMNEFSEWLLSPDRDALLPEIEPISSMEGETVPDSVIVQGFGVFREAKLVGWLDKEESLGYLLISRKLKNVHIVVPFTKDNKSLSYYISGSKNKINFKIIDGKPSFKIKIQTVGFVAETDGYDITPDQIKPLERIISDKIREYPLKSIACAKKYDADYFGLMQKIHRYAPSYWQEIAPNWRGIFQQADVEVEIEAKIAGSGAVSKSFSLKP